MKPWWPWTVSVDTVKEAWSEKKKKPVKSADRNMKVWKILYSAGRWPVRTAFIHSPCKSSLDWGHYTVTWAREIGLLCLLNQHNLFKRRWVSFLKVSLRDPLSRNSVFLIDWPFKRKKPAEHINKTWTLWRRFENDSIAIQVTRVSWVSNNIISCDSTACSAIPSSRRHSIARHHYWTDVGCRVNRAQSLSRGTAVRRRGCDTLKAFKWWFISWNQTAGFCVALLVGKHVSLRNS